MRYKQSALFNLEPDYLNWCPRLKMRLILGLILSLGIVAAEQPKIFPPGSLGRDDDWDRSRSDQLSGCLRSFKEASIWQASRKHVPGAVYRFMWLRSFHPAISVRLDIAADGAAILTTKISNGCCDCAPSPADTKQKPFRVKTTVRKISAPQLCRFLSRVEAVHFWTLLQQKGLLACPQRGRLDHRSFQGWTLPTD
jgi:hypothetical protein